MHVIGVVVSGALGVMFVVSGFLKISASQSWMQQSADLRVPRPVARVVPWFEVLLGASLLTGLLHPWPSIVAVITLVVFTWFLARRMLDGTRPPCACFGSRSVRPLGPRHLARNAVLIALATVAVVAG